MFDWNDNEIGDVIWGETSESDDHIVPYPEGHEEKPLAGFGERSKKEFSQEVSNGKFAEENMPESKNESLRPKLESKPQFNSNDLPTPEFDMNSWVETEISRLDSGKGDSAQLDSGLGLFGNDFEDKQHGGFLDENWASIGNFDDLDRIFRNEDSIFKCGSLENADELWSSSADVFSSPLKSLSLSMGSPTSGLKAFNSISEKFELGAETCPQNDPSIGYGLGNKTHPGSDVGTDVETRKDNAAGKGPCNFADRAIERLNMPTASDEGNRKRKSSKYFKKEENSIKTSEGLSDDCYMTANQFPPFGSQLTTSVQTFPSSVLSPQMQPSEPKMYLPPYHHHLFVGGGNHTHLSVMMPNVHSEKDGHQSGRPGYEFPLESPKTENSWNEFQGTLTMTPQAKLEKLRRRQKMQAMLAIQKQQQQFGQRVPCIDHSSTENYLPENQSQDTETSGLEVDENLKASLFRPSSPQKKDNSNSISMVIDNYSLAESVLDQLQEVIKKLDMKIRLCIRDSLFRLAHSAIQRNKTTDMSSTTSGRVGIRTTAGDETDDRVTRIPPFRLTRIPDAETETNPIDRTVAHLLFNRLSQLSGIAVKDEIHESASTELKCESRDVDQFHVSTCISTPENKPSAEPGYNGKVKVEAS
ncbi:hypothetical protein Sjap_012831 [Stephania japonica]|uniref:Protein LNK2 n=1 Tax=Stephania japonica TaxID=461633 RepID=A0AAP0IWU3_9MAGN